MQIVFPTFGEVMWDFGAFFIFLVFEGTSTRGYRCSFNFRKKNIVDPVYKEDFTENHTHAFLIWKRSNRNSDHDTKKKKKTIKTQPAHRSLYSPTTWREVNNLFGDSFKKQTQRPQALSQPV